MPQPVPTSPATIEEILFKEGLLTQQQLQAVKLEALNTGQRTDKIIQAHNLVPSVRLAEARAAVMGVPFINIAGKGVSTEVLNLIPEAVAQRYHLIPFDKTATELMLAMVDPLDIQAIQFVEEKSGLRVKPFLAPAEDIQKAIQDQYSQNLTSEVSSALQEVNALNQPNEKAQQAQESEAEVVREAPVANIISQLLEYAVKVKASDIHIEPLEDKTRVRYRIDGILHEKIILPHQVHDALISRIKIMSSLKIDEKRLPQDGRFAYTSGSSVYDLRISTVPTIYGEKVVMRLLPKSAAPPTLQELGLRGPALKDLETQIRRPHGIVLICGPTGSGKTTTLYSILTKISTTAVNILTIEDPVEYQIPGANQVQVNPQIGLSFASALRSFLRQDPNIMMVGEIRDTETADLAIQAALTGHELFSTLHTNSASGALPRLLDMGVEPFLLASSVNTIESQRILRRICPHCKTELTPPPEVIESLKKVLGNLMPQKPPEQIKLYKGAGCQVCGQSGYLGRIGIFEVLVINSQIMNLILQRASADQIEKQAVSGGMITLLQDGFLKILEGITTMEEVLRVAQD